ncbi:Acyltransferase AGPAT6, partial [Operophtera brumata]
MSEWWSGTKLSIYVNKDEYEKLYGKEHGYLIMNHSYEIDWLMGWQFCDGIGVLGKVIQYLPPIGWMWKFSEFVFLERSFDKDRETIKTQILELCDYPDPVWLLLNPEGTRYTKEKHDESLKFAKEKNLPLLKHHLTPRTKGSPQRLQVYCSDKMQESFLNTGSFFKESGVPSVEPFAVSPRIYSLLNTLGWAIVTLTPMLYYLLGLLLSGRLLYFSIGVAIFGACKYYHQPSAGPSSR